VQLREFVGRKDFQGSIIQAMATRCRSDRMLRPKIKDDKFSMHAIGRMHDMHVIALQIGVTWRVG
jgi:hypothetical protein